MLTADASLCITFPQEDKISMILSLTSSVLSIIGSALTIIYFSILIRKKTESGNFTLNKLILLLGVCDFIGALFICIQDAQLLMWSSGYSSLRCSIFRIVIQFFYTCTFFWTAFIAIVIFKELQHLKFVESHELWTIFHSIGWGFPICCVIVLIVEPSWTIETEGGCSYLSVGFLVCSDDFMPHPYWFLQRVPIRINFQVSLYSIIAHRLRILLKSFSSEYPTIWQLQKRVCFYLVAFVFCWSWDITYSFIHLFYCPPSWLWFLEQLFPPLQGFVNFLIYTLGNIELSKKKEENQQNSGEASILSVERLWRYYS